MTITLTDLLEYEMHLAEMLSLVKPFFNKHYGSAGDDRAELWLEMPNPLLGGLSPTDLIKQGHIKKLKAYLKENER
jgi:hypothetical protein